MSNKRDQKNDGRVKPVATDAPVDLPSANDLDRYERLQVAAERQIDKCWETFKKRDYLLAVILAVFGGLGAYFFLANISDFKKEIRDEIREEKDIVAKRVETRIDEATAAENLRAIIAQRVSLVTDEVISNNIQNAISPKLLGIEQRLISTAQQFSSLTNQVVLLQAEIAAARLSSKEIQEGTDLALTILSASNGERSAFDKLVRLRDQETNSYRLQIVNAIGNILGALETHDSAMIFSDILWDKLAFKPDEATWEDYLEKFTSGQLSTKFAQHKFLLKLADQSRFPREKRLQLYHELLNKAPNLQLLHTTCQIVNREAKLDLNILGASRYIKWVEVALRSDCITNYTEVVKLNPQDAGAYARRADCYYEQKDYTNAINDYRRSIQINPKDHLVLNNIAWLLATCPEDLLRSGKEAVEYAKQACELSSWKTAHCIGTLAGSYAEVGKFDLAIKYQKEAIALEGPGSNQDQMKQKLKLFEEGKAFHE